MASGKSLWKAKPRGSNAQALTNGVTWGKADGAIREITQQLQKNGSDGRVWVHDWGRRYESALGSLRDFLESNPDKFVVVPGEGKRYTVALVDAAPKRSFRGAAKGGSMAKSGKGGATKVQSGWGAQNGGKGSSCWSKGNRGVPVNGGWDPTIATAIREIKEQLLAPGNDGNVWIRQWGSRFQESLGSLRDFLESRPDKFTVIPSEGRKFRVALAGAAAGSAAGKRKAGPTQEAARPAKWPKAQQAAQALVWVKKEERKESEEELTEAAIVEIRRQLERPGNTGSVWIKSWPRRFQDTLGTVRDFLECHPDKFIVLPGEGKKFTVELMDP